MSGSWSFADRRGGPERNDNIVFSYVDGYVWMSWPGAVAAVRVGTYEAATAAMQDFLAQCELGERLVNGNARSPSAPSS